MRAQIAAIVFVFLMGMLAGTFADEWAQQHDAAIAQGQGLSQQTLPNSVR